MQNPSAPAIVLASSSRYRRDLLNRFLDSYEVLDPEVDESNTQNLGPEEL
ncbi:MAG: Maf family protein, partial [Gammaproteobacteria bacterium]|nr:Maf family protein [Gammaproteobacteria bacterium]